MPWRSSGLRNLCLAGGVALNCVANGRILREGPYERLWIQPASGDAGGALGAALFVWHQLLENPRSIYEGDSQEGSLLGPRFSTAAVEAVLRGRGAAYTRIADEGELCRRVSKLITEGRVVGWFRGRMEFGPRALGSRSILGDARSTDMQRVLNLKIKFRESFRPFAPAVLSEKAGEYFGLGRGTDSPYMLLVADVDNAKRTDCLEQLARASGFSKLEIPRSVIPAVTHVDFSARVQTVDARRHGAFYRLLKTFEEKTGSPVLINTSFNVRGEPIVCTPEDAYRCFMATDMDALVLEDCLLLKSEQPAENRVTREEHLAKFELD